MATGQTREMRRDYLNLQTRSFGTCLLLAETIGCRGGGGSVPQQPKPHYMFPPSSPSSATTLQPPSPSSPVFTPFHVTCPCTEHIPLVAGTKCPLRYFLQVDVLAQLIVRVRGGLDQFQALHYPPQLLNGSQCFRSVPNFPANCQSSQILPARSIILSSNNMPRTYANLELLYHTSGMPSPFAAPCTFSFAF